MTSNRIPSHAELAHHARQIAVAFRIQLVERAELHELQICANPAQGICLVWPIKDEITYAVAMHEMGHCLSPSGVLRDQRNIDNPLLQLDEENSAWEWAQHYALDWTVAMEQLKITTLSTYENNASRYRAFLKLKDGQKIDPKEIERRREAAVRYVLDSLKLGDL